MNKEIKFADNGGRVVFGDVFIIPNGLMSKDNILGDWTQFCVQKQTDWLDCGLRVPTLIDHEFIQIWTCGSESDNWHDHGCKAVGGAWPQYFPKAWFMGLMEGDTLVLKGIGVEYHLTLSQSQYRYKHFGPFEKVLANVL